MTDKEKAKIALLTGALTGLLMAIAGAVAFGILDIQCRNDPNGRYWNAEQQQCQATEAGGEFYPYPRG
ncbi:MAG: hypothetical protein WCY11_05295 [Novosphingobium sp.]